MESQIEISQRFSPYGIEPAVINALYLADLSILLGLSNGSLTHAHFIEKFLDLLFFQEERIVQHEGPRISWRELKMRIRVSDDSHEVDSSMIMEGLFNSWEQFQALVHELPDQEIDSMKAFFNSLEGMEYHKFGDCLAGEIDKPTFTGKVEKLAENDTLENLTFRLLVTGLVDKEFER